MNQLAIDFSVSHARRFDPSTSHVAASKAERFAKSHAGRILQTLKLHGPCTARDINQLTGLTVEQVARRLPDLAESKLAAVWRSGGVDVVRDGFRVWMAL